MGKDVQASAATTEQSTTTAHPNGTFTVEQSLVPVRKHVSGAWVDLDATLRRNADGTVSPAVTSSSLSLSGGGSGALATMAHQGRKLALGFPVKLPAPTLDGATATYPNVFDGVDLKVTTDTRGSFSEVLVVKDAKAAANPALKKLRLTAKTDGVTLSTDEAGNITAGDRRGNAVFTAPAPFMWDSATAAATTGGQAKTLRSPGSGQTSGEPAASSEKAPGDSAHTARVAAQATGDGIDLTPDAALLKSPDTKYPLYIDPTFYPASASGSRQGWAQTNSTYPNQANYNTNDVLRVGYNGWESPYFTARSYMQVSVDPAMWDSSVISSQINFTGVWSGSCTANNTELWLAPNGSSLGNSTTWNNAPAPQTYVGSSNAMFWGGTNCDPRGVGFDTRSVMATAAANHYSSMVFVLKAQYENNDRNSWKKFANAVTVSTTYNHAPDRPGTLTTSPSTWCPGGEFAGDGDVWLYGGVSDRDGGTLGAAFHAVKHGTSTTIVPDSNPNLLTAQSGSTLAFKLPKANLEAVAGGQLLQVDWTVTATDFYASSPTSTTCSFLFDPTRPGAPAVTPPSGTTLGTSVSVNISPVCALSTPSTCTAGNTPSSYEYQLNGAGRITVAATNGNATISVKPNRRTNVLTVTSLSPAGNIGQSATVTFNSAAAAPANDGDFTGDGTPDLLTVGGQHGLTSGIWLARGDGQNATRVSSSAVDIGINGNGYSSGNVPADFDGALAISGHFTDTNLQDVLVYYPRPSGNVGGGVILNGSGDGSAIPSAQNGNAHTVPAGAFQDINGNNPLRLAPAGTVSGSGAPYPDVIGISGDDANGYALNLYQGTGTIGAFQFPVQINVSTPNGTADWDKWTIATCQVPAGTGTRTAMYLWNRTTGQLALWKDLAVDPNTGTLTYTPVSIAANWNTGKDLALEAADVNADGIPDLWVVGDNRNVTAYLVTSLPSQPGGSASITTATDVLTPYLGLPAAAPDDLNSDGVGDLVAEWGDGSLHAYFGDRTTGLASQSLGQLAGTTWWPVQQIAMGEFTGDYAADVMAVWSDGSLHLYKGDGNGHLTDGVALTKWGTSWGGMQQLEAGDFNGDGISDLVAIWSDGSMHIYPGDGHGDLKDGVALTQFGTTWNRMPQLAAGDFDGDKIADMMAVWTDGSLHLYKGGGSSYIVSSTALTQFGTTWKTVRQFVASDVNGDRNADLLAVWEDGTMHVYKGDGRGNIDDGTALSQYGTTWYPIRLTTG
ncbi:FG-GAP-like repeat-containing protein [Kitasatospora sp. DSM 101779]|uniref:FG-GAP-like repeat-containing protein n=1 Tax=Kitasatospora sp. DSM 101779 TaxID=2853165 RepID=UPI0021DA5D60|nr:FG-GAP-like repeat-containing protein [Kitasatospora sp. DSM 101779]MCU7820152.1 VCBS repeat-containing protein [Kitasatospora sp. DSM 101779]